MSYDVDLVHGESLSISINILEKVCNHTTESDYKSCFLK